MIVGYIRFGGACCLHLQDASSSGYLKPLRNVGSYQLTLRYTPQHFILHQERCETHYVTNEFGQVIAKRTKEVLRYQHFGLKFKTQLIVVLRLSIGSSHPEPTAPAVRT